ncbi:hypothetical protein GBK02_09085 [Dechloromonas sp. TW-R-39-2]|uniref:hypothetical protein n=1 Tax=Dechloromonas sp. TW-R-39-2 TaxID=2654218 RepID=UPI00193E5F89|nr:hypothetical protein [Dechloromonas sp. TW-R-39-2]QRM19543.1 hypothetical protein GBK02_09085 [Dechloromonas sp. TW-R-39-2]
MTRNDIRLTNLITLVAEHGSITSLAEAAGVSEKYLSQILTGTKLPSGRVRQVGNKIARSLESGSGRTTGWMDRDHTSQSVIVDEITLSPTEEELIRLFRAATAAKRRAMMAVARL